MMDTDISLTANGVYTANFATVSSPTIGLMQFGWVYVIGYSGNAKVTITDQDGIVHPEADVPVPGIHAAVLRESTPPQVSKVVIRATADGFRGKICFDILHVVGV